MELLSIYIAGPSEALTVDNREDSTAVFETPECVMMDSCMYKIIIMSCLHKRIVSIFCSF